MSRESARKAYFARDSRDKRRDPDPRERDIRAPSRDHWNRDRADFRSYGAHRSVTVRRTAIHGDENKRRSRSPGKGDKDLDENILREISKLPEPSELWDNQFQDGNFPPPLNSTFNPEPSLPNPNFATNFQTPSSSTYQGIYDDFPPVASVSTVLAPPPPEWNLPPLAAPSTPFIPNIEDQIKKEAAIESEMRHQKAALSKQREDYIKKSNILKKELDTLKDQRNELRGDSKRSPSPDTKRFLKENTKLQLEIQNKLKTINNVVDMLNGIIGEEAQEQVETEVSPDRDTKKRKSRSPSSNKKFNYVYYDPEMHWCRVCNEFPPTAKDYLNHLHSPAHHKMAAAHMEAPWHSVTGINEGFPSYPSAPTKRTPIRGLQFFVPSTAWYCKLCDQFIGDLHCASAHLKSVVHSKNYSNFVEQNPHWETDWMSDRQKSLEKTRATKVKVEEKPKVEEKYTAHTITFHKGGFHTKTRKESPPPPVEVKKEKAEKKKKSKIKKRKRSSSSSSSSSAISSSDSDQAKKKKTKKKDKEKPNPDLDDQVLSEWMSSINANRLSESDRKLLDSLKFKIKQEKRTERRPSPKRSSRDRERERAIAESQRKLRDIERREERRLEDRRRRESRPPSVKPASPPREKVEPKKMPFIGKMPVFKSLTKTSKSDEVKKEEQKKKDEEEATKKRREEMDAEIQRKVAEFKEKIARAQLERERQVTLPPPQLVELPLPLPLPAPAPPAPPPQAAAPPPQPPVPNLPKDFQDALDIIFPSETKKAELAQQDLFGGMPPMPGFPGLPLHGLPQFPPLLPGMPPFMGFDMNAPLFPPPTQLYDTHVPIVPNKQRQQNKNHNNNRNQKNNLNKIQELKKTDSESAMSKVDAQAKKEKNGNVERKKEELDDLAMLGIDASDVGAGI